MPNFAPNIDLAPTFCEWAGISPRPYMDGRSLAPLLSGESVPWRTDFLVELWAEGGVPTYRGVGSNEGRVYVEYSSGASAGDRESYDVRDDTYQLNNLTDEGEIPAYLRERLAALKACSGGCVQVGRRGQQDVSEQGWTLQSCGDGSYGSLRRGHRGGAGLYGPSLAQAGWDNAWPSVPSRGRNGWRTVIVVAF